jgi:hypothetical protein
MVGLGDTGTLSQLYANLTSDAANNAWPKFKAAVQALHGGLTSDDPFGGASQPAQLAHLAPWTVELAGKVFAVILTDVATGKAPNQIVASVRAAMASSPALKANSAAAAQCVPRSRRLLPPDREQA